MLDRLRGLFPGRESEEAGEAAPKRALSLASAALLVGGAGVAFWWYTQWAHGRGDQEADLGSVLPSAAKDALDESLAVQADATPQARNQP